MVLLDVVYNHFGPDGNYLPTYAPGFFTKRHKTPWGDAINYDGKHSKPVREFVIENALYWIKEFHLDGLRLDAVHAIIDDTPKHVLDELAERVRAEVTDSHVHLGRAQVLDFVPNHMGVCGADNPLWLDLLEWGPDSAHAGWFDIDWDPDRRYLRDKLLLWAYDTHKLPICPLHYARRGYAGTPRGAVRAAAGLGEAGDDLEPHPACRARRC